MHASFCPTDTPFLPLGFETLPGEAALNAKHIPFFHKLLCEWPTAISTNSLWGVIIEPRNESFFAQLINSVNAFEPSQYGNWSVANGFDEIWTYNTQKQIGCTFARGVIIPGEGFQTGFAGAPGGHQRGFLNVPIAADRSQTNTISLSILETNSSFADFCLRPWIVMANHKGFLAYPDDQSIKAHITAFLMAKAGPNVPLVIRKIYSFYDCVPINIDGESLMFGNDSDVKERVVDFAYNYYTVNSHEFTV